MARVLFVFLDGVGLGPPDPETNPFFRAALPTLRRVLGGGLPSLDSPTLVGPSARAFPLDACLGVQGTPQSGTGQVALLTGRNAPRLFGRHFGPWPPVRLRPSLQTESFLSRAIERGARVAFANAYPRGYPGTRDTRRVAAVPYAAQAAGLLTRDHEALGAGLAVASEIVNDRWIQHAGGSRLPTVTPEEAGANLSRIAEDADLTVYAHYHTDAAGHRGGMSGAVAALERVDTFLAGVVENIASDTLLLLASDHGNIEDTRVGHTRNPALGLAIGSRSLALSPPTRLTDVAGLLVSEATG